jgi:hypothetical protein
MIRDNVDNVRAIIDTAFELGTKDDNGHVEDRYTLGYRQGIFDLAGQILWPDRSWTEQRDRLHALFSAHRALFVEAMD